MRIFKAKKMTTREKMNLNAMVRAKFLEIEEVSKKKRELARMIVMQRRLERFCWLYNLRKPAF